MHFCKKKSLQRKNKKKDEIKPGMYCNKNLHFINYGIGLTITCIARMKAILN